MLLGKMERRREGEQINEKEIKENKKTDEYMTCDAGFCQRIERIGYVLAGSDNVFDIVFLELL